jgi:hypothetical protein
MNKKAFRRTAIIVCNIAAVAMAVWWLPSLREGILRGLSRAAGAGWGDALCALLTVAVVLWALTRAGIPSSRRVAGQDAPSDPQVALAFKKRRLLQLALLRPLAALLALLMVGIAVFGEGGVLWMVFLGLPTLILAIAALVLRLVNWRCPACGKLLKGLNPTHCGKCGARLRG